MAKRKQSFGKKSGDEATNSGDNLDTIPDLHGAEIVSV